METYHGHVRTPADAIILFEACRIGLLPRVQRRLSEKERQSIKSGSVFVWDEREAGMRRWTDGKSWSASRVSGSFLTYREMEGKRGGSSVSRGGKTPESTRGSDDDREGGEEGPDGYRYKPDGLMKQSFSITTSTGQHLHLISYYARSHPTAPNLQQPSTDPALRHIRPQKGLYPESTVNDQQNLPVVTRGPMAGATFSLSPHPAIGYPRSGATHPQSYAPTYAWPPTPLPTPPTMTIPYTYLPPLTAPAAQLTYAHHPPALPAPPPQHALPAPYDSHAHHPSESTLPPPLPPSTAAAPALPAFAGRSATVPQSSVDTQPRTSYGPGSIDPRLMSPRTQSLQAQRNGEPPRTIPSPPQQKLVVSSQPPHLAPPTSAASSATTVPSIGALMNGASVPPLSTDAPKAGELPRTGSRSPNEASTTPDGPKDIPSEKIGFGGEDIRAIRQLDRVFTV